MFRHSSLAILAIPLVCVTGLADLEAGERGKGSPPFVHSLAIQSGASPEDIITLAANVVPNRPQMLYHQDEFTGFVHFGPNTYSGVEWGSGMEDPTVFNPGHTLDTDQWCRIMKAAGMKKVIITAKHHDGFCIWQSRYNDSFSVRATSWQSGQGDVMRELSDSCKKYGLKLGVYLSPADLYQIESRTGLYGNESRYVESIIPTEPDSLRSQPTEPRVDRPLGTPTFTVTVDDYNRYFMNQLYELLTDYGPIQEVWFDGAHPKRKGGQKYVKDEWFKMIRVLAPEAAIFGGPDIRWCGNEGGYTRESEWSVLPVESEEASGVDRPDESPGSQEALVTGNYEVYGKKYKSTRLQYLVCEVDTSIRAGWFWRNEHEQSVRTPDDVFDIYERSVGGNAGFLLNIPPNQRGLFGERDEACLIEVGRRIQKTYGTDLSTGATFEAKDKTCGLRDGDLSTYWQPESIDGTLIARFPETKTINRIVLQEAIATVGQRIEKHELDAWIDGDWREIARATTVGYKRILRFPTVATDRVRIRVVDSRLPPTIAEVSAHYYDQPLPTVVVTRDENQRVVMTTTSMGSRFDWKRHGKRSAIPNEHTLTTVRYTVDGSDPGHASSIYEGPFELPDGGHVRARAFSDEDSGAVTSTRLGISKRGWHIHSVSSQEHESHAAENAIDGDPCSYWITSRLEVDSSQPLDIAIDLGRIVNVEGITYLPRQDRSGAEGMIESGHVEISVDAEDWISMGGFRFGNLVNDPTQRTYLFDRPVAARFVRMVSKRAARGAPQAGAAEIGVLAVLRANE